MQNKNKDLDEIADGIVYKYESNFSSLREMANNAHTFPDKLQLFGNYILEGDIVILPSPAGVGKTWFALNIALFITNRMASFLNEPITLHGNVLYVNYELSTRTLSKRANKLLSAIERNENAFECLVLNSRGGLKKDLKSIYEKVVEKNVVLLIIDNLNMADVSIDAMSSKDMVKLMCMLLAIQEVTKSAILLIDHVRKKD